MSRCKTLWIGAGIEIVLSFSQTITGYMMGKEGIVFPTAAVWLLCGFIAVGMAAKHLKALTSEVPKS